MAVSIGVDARTVGRLAAGGSIALIASLLIGASAAGAATKHSGSASQSAHRTVATCKHRSADRVGHGAATKAGARKAAQLKAQCAAEARKAAAKAAKSAAAKAKKAAGTEKKASATESALTTVTAQHTAAAGTSAHVQAVHGKAVTAAHNQQILRTSLAVREQQLAAAAAAAQAQQAKAASTELTRTALRQASAVGSAFSTGSTQPSSGTSAPQAGTTPAQAVQVRAGASKAARTVSHPVQAPRKPLAAPIDRPVSVQLPIQLAQAGLSLGAGPLVLLGLVVVCGLATVVAGTRRRMPGRHG